MISIGHRVWFFLGNDLLRDRPTLALGWGLRGDAEPGESMYRHQWAVSWPLVEFIYYRDEMGRVWPCGIFWHGFVLEWRWHLPL